MMWRRALIAGFAISLIPNVVGFVYGLTLPWTLPLLGPPGPEAFRRGLLVRLVVIAVCVFVAYLVFLRRIPRAPLAHAALAFVAAEAFLWLEAALVAGAAAAFVRGVRFAPPPAPTLPYLAVHALLAAAAVGVSAMRRRRVVRQTSLT
jgi:hypothetical protein